MDAVMLMSVLVFRLCVLAYPLAVYALPFMIGVTAAPAAVIGYALVHGVTEVDIPSEIWRQIFCVIGGAFVLVSALMRLAGGIGQPAK